MQKKDLIEELLLFKWKCIDTQNFMC
jgi:hypothetical protein